MKKFKCTVTRVDEYEIEFDENIINEEWMREFRGFMYSFATLKEHAEHLAQFQARFGDYAFIEGYGAIKRNNEISYPYKIEELSEDELAININIISEDENCEVEVEEI